MENEAIEQLEMDLLVQAVRRAYGYDFAQYATASLRRRLRLWLARSEFDSFSQAQGRILREPALFEKLLQGLTVNVTAMFRDADFYRALRAQVLPDLHTSPFIQIWHAGCSTGEEVYSMAILLHEAGLAGRYRLYATDINDAVLHKAREGIFANGQMQDYTRNYHEAGGQAAFSDYYTARYGKAIMAPGLREHIVFAPHNLLTDAGFGEMDMVLCRNVMIYFQAAHKARCVDMLDASLRPGGFLCLGDKESLDGKAVKPRYHRLAPRLPIFAKRYGYAAPLA